MFRSLFFSLLFLSIAISGFSGVQRLPIGGTPQAPAPSFGSLEHHHPTLDLAYLDNGSLYAVNTSTGAVIPLLPFKDDWFSVETSPDGSRLMAKALDGSLWSVPATGGTAAQLTACGDIFEDADGNYHSFVISADSMRVAFIQNGVAWSVPIAGGVPLALTPSAWAAAGGEALSIQAVPGSNLLVVAARASSSDPSRLYRVLPTGAGFLALTTNTWDIEAYRTNTTGSHVIFTHAGKDELASVNLGGTPLEVALHAALGPFGIRSFESTPDGAQVIFSDEKTSSLVTLFRVAVTGGMPSEIVTSGLTEGLPALDTEFLLSPDGQHVVFTQEHPVEGLYSAPVAGGAAVTLHEGSFGHLKSHPAPTVWAGNNHVLIKDDNDDLWAMSYVTPGVLLPDDVTDATISPDGDHAVFISSSGDLTQTRLDGSTTVVLGQGVSFASGHVVNAHAGDTRYLALDAASGQLWKATLGLADSAAIVPAIAPETPGYAQAVKISPDGRHAVYLENSTAGAYWHDLHLASLEDGSSVPLTTGGAIQMGAGTESTPCSFSDDSQWLVYWAYSTATSHRCVLYARRLADGLTVLLSDPATSAFFAGIRETQGDVLFTAGDDLWRAPLDGSSSPENLTPDLDERVFLLDLSEDESLALVSHDGLEVLLVTLEGTRPPVKLASYTNYTTLQQVYPVFTADDTGVLLMGNYRASLSRYEIASGASTELYSSGSMSTVILAMHQKEDTVVISVNDATNHRHLRAISLSTGVDTVLTSLWSSRFSVGDDWLLTSDGSTVIHAVEAAGKGELHAINTGTAADTKLNGTLPVGGNVTSFQLTPDESTVVYRADQTADGIFELFAVPATGGTPARISAAMTGSAGVLEDWHIASDQHVIYRSELGTPGYARLFGAPLAAGSAVQLSDAGMPAWASVREFAPSADGTQVVFSADPLLNGQWTFFDAQVEPVVSIIADPVSLMNTTHGPVTFTVDDLETASDDLQVTVQSSNIALLVPSNAALGGSGSSRTFTLTPNPDTWGRTLVTLLVTDGSTTSARQFTWMVTPDANDAPSNLALTPSSIAENQPAGTIAGYFSANDADAWDIHSYALVSGSGDLDNGLFLIQDNALRATVPFNYETRTAYSIRVRATDFVGSSFEKIINVTIDDLRGVSQPVTLTTREGMGLFFEDQDFIDRFALQDGGSLAKVRIESVPLNGSLSCQLGRREIDTAASGAQALATGDVNGDGRPDFVAVLAGTGDVVWYENSGSSPPAFTRRHVASTLNHPRDVAVGDADKDGDLDIFVAEHGANRILCFRSSGGTAPTFAPITVFSGAGGLSSLTVADVNGDSHLDVISTHPLGNRVALHFNDGASPPSFIGTTLSTSEAGVSDAVVFDVDLDGDLDIVSAAATGGEVAWFEQAGASFTRRTIATGLPQPASLDRADIDGDSRLDLVVATSGDNSVNWYENIPPATTGAAPTFLPYLVSSSIASVASVLATDFTGDNVPDILACSPVDGRILGFQTFRAASVVFATHQIDKNAVGAAAIASTDFTANGRPDLVACHASASIIAWYQDERLLTGGDEVTTHELHKLRYQPHMGFTGDDAFGWRGHDGVGWSFHPSVVTLKVIAGKYWDWLVAAFGLESVSDFSESVATWGDSTDADGDGRSTLLEYAFGGDPASGSDSGEAVAATQQTETDGTVYFHLSFIRRHSDPGLTYTPEVSTDFTAWNSGPAYFDHITPDVVLDADFTQVTYRYLVPVTSGSPGGFFRVKVERAP